MSACARTLPNERAPAVDDLVHLATVVLAALALAPAFGRVSRAAVALFRYAGEHAPKGPERVLATVLFADIVGSTERAARSGDRGWRELLEAYLAIVRRQLAGFGGREIDTAGDGFLAAFDTPARAIRCAHAIRAGARSLGIEIRAGVHAGECEVMANKLGGIAVHIGARIAAEARPGEILVSQTVRDLVTGSGLEFADRGEQPLRGVPGDWRLCAFVR